jgi:hypothetical protein
MRALGVLGLLISGLLVSVLIWTESLHATRWMVLGLGCLLLLAERYFAVRLSFDQGLFARLASGEIESLAALDHSLQNLGLRTASAGEPRSLLDRIKGTRRLVNIYICLVGIQVTLLLGVVLNLFI